MTVEEDTKLQTALRTFRDVINSAPTDKLYNLLQAEIIAPDAGGIAMVGLIALQSRILNAEVITKALFNKESTVELSPLSFPVGFKSPDGSALLGREGFLFLIGGSNDVIGQYSSDLGLVEPIAGQWADFFTSRKNAVEGVGAEYFHTILPEKISALPDKFPSVVCTPMPILSAFERKILEKGYGRHYISGLDIVNKFEKKSQLFRRYDSHLSPLGAHLIFGEIVSCMCESEMQRFDFDVLRTGNGDLAFRMTGLNPVDEYLEVNPEAFPSFVNSTEKVEEFTPPAGSHMGRRQVWANPDAPIDAKLVVFGNSFFSFAENGQAGLSWWASRWFREFHFIWTNEIDLEYVGLVRPDFVLWQGIERFLNILPAC